MRDDVVNASASALDDLWRRSNEARRQAEVEQSYPFDPDCRFGAVDVTHRCTDPFGAPVRAGGTCFSEANAQMHDQRRREQFALQHGFAMASGLDCLPPCSQDGAE